MRLKKDKIFGTNMSTNNPALVKQINRNLDRVLADIEQHRYQEIAI